MNDCSNAEIRDQLPDLLHERLDTSARAAVMAHVATCIDCTEELQLLRDVLGMIDARTPRVDVAMIVSALPKPPIRTAPRVLPSMASVAGTRRRRIWSDWRIAAAVTLLVAGGGSAVLLNREHVQGPATSVASRASTSHARPAISPSTVIAPPTATAPSHIVNPSAAPASPETVASADDHADADLGNGNRLGDLSEQQLQTLLKEIDKLPAVPVTEPEPVSLRVHARGTSSDGEGDGEDM